MRMSSNRFFSQGAFVAVVLSALLFSGCGSRIDVSSNDSSVSLTDKQTGDVLIGGENAAIPDTFPQDVPRYPNATKTLLVLKDSQQNSYQTSQNTGDDVATVVRWLETFYQPKGFTKTNEIGDGVQMKLVDFQDAASKIHFQIARDPKNTYTNILMVRVANGVQGQ